VRRPQKQDRVLISQVFDGALAVRLEVHELFVIEAIVVRLGATVLVCLIEAVILPRRIDVEDAIGAFELSRQLGHCSLAAWRQSFHAVGTDVGSLIQ
jgi:hypothetical protein